MKIEFAAEVEGLRFRFCVESADGDTHSFITDHIEQVRAAVRDAREEFLFSLQRRDLNIPKALVTEPKPMGEFEERF